MSTQAITSVGIYCSSSRELSPDIYDLGRRLGSALAMAGYTMVYGGTTCGLMDVVSSAHKNAGGRLVGVLPRFMDEKGLTSSILDEKVLVSSMADRKTALCRHSDAFIVLPGGFGTFDELFDVVTQKQLDLHTKPIVILNWRGFYDHLAAMFQRCVEEKTVSAKYLSLFQMVADVPEALTALTR
jgi:hypothetical protein